MTCFFYARIFLLLVFFLGLGPLTACAVLRDDAATLLGRGRYGEAMERLQEEEANLPRKSSAERARYALYRGLTHLALDDRPAAYRWLLDAKTRWDRNPQTLSQEDTGRLLNAWTGLGKGL
jgi:hypothetical protein